MGWVWAVVLVAGCGGTATGEDAGAPAIDARTIDAPIAIDAPTAIDAPAAIDARAAIDAAPDAPVAIDAGPGDAGPTDEIRVLTINLRNAYIDAATWPQRRDMIAALIVGRQPDVVAMQEVTETGGEPNGAEQIASRAPGYSFEYFRTHEAFVFDEGLGVLSRWPIASTATRELPHVDLGGIAHRSVLLATVTHPDGALRLFATHLTVSTDPDDRADQAAEIVRFVDANAGTLPGFLAGDMNAEPDETSMRMLRGEVMHDGERGDYVDAWTIARPGEDGFTIPSDAPDRRIDYVYGVPSSTGETFTVRSCEIVLDVPEMGVYASDHVGVLCTFERI